MIGLVGAVSLHMINQLYLKRRNGFGSLAVVILEVHKSSFPK
jgi:hypothetical protein